MIAELTSLISTYGLHAVLAAVLIYILLRGEVRFRYPRSGKKLVATDETLSDVPAEAMAKRDGDKARDTDKAEAVVPLAKR
jgi:hypothetical protein